MLSCGRRDKKAYMFSNQMWTSPSVIIICFAIINVCVSYVWNKISRHVPESSVTLKDLENSIFVCYIVYKDTRWIRNVVDNIKKALHSNRVFFGIIEYVDEACPSMVEHIPKDLRNHIRVSTRASKISTTLCKSRQSALKTLYSNERYVLFIRSVDLCNHWDERMCSSMKDNSRRTVLTAHISNHNRNSFSTILRVEDKNIVIGTQPMFVHESNSGFSPQVKAIVFCPDFCFCDAEHATHACADDTPIGVSAVLYNACIGMHHPGFCVGTRTLHPYGVRMSKRCRIDAQKLAKFCNHIGVDIKNTKVGVDARCGLSVNADADECIIKYGSVSQANVKLQMLATTM